LFAAETGCSLHVVHVSSGRGIGLIAEARRRGIDVSCETCPHYLVLTEDDLDVLGAVAKCAPPLRQSTEQETLWEHLFAGTLPMVASDHSPAPAEMKASPNVFEVWGGISGCQSTLQLLLTEGYERRHFPLAAIAAVTAEYVSRRFGFWPEKGCLATGADADLVVVDLAQSSVLQGADLFYRHRHSPYTGRRLRGRVVRTIVRGRTIFREGEFVSAPIGQLLKPSGRMPGERRKKNSLEGEARVADIPATN